MDCLTVMLAVFLILSAGHAIVLTSYSDFLDISFEMDVDYEGYGDGDWEISTYIGMCGSSERGYPDCRIGTSDFPNSLINTNPCQ